MRKIDIDRITLWMTLGCSLCTIWSFEVDINARKKSSNRQTSEQATLDEINNRLIQIEKRLNRLTPDDH